MVYEEKKFDLPQLQGLSKKQIDIHLGLYGGYVKHVNLLREQLHELESVGGEKFAYAGAETRRRLGFEFNGMRMHEYYFEQFEGGREVFNPHSPLSKILSEKYGSVEKSIEHFKMVGAGTRGIGWTILSFDQRANTPHMTTSLANSQDFPLSSQWTCGNMPIWLTTRQARRNSILKHFSAISIGV